MKYHIETCMNSARVASIQISLDKIPSPIIGFQKFTSAEISFPAYYFNNK